MADRGDRRSERLPQVGLHVTLEERSEIRRRAFVAGLPMSGWIRQRLLGPQTSDELTGAVRDLRARLRVIDDLVADLDGALDRVSDALGIPAGQRVVAAAEAGPRCSCTHEAGDSECAAHPSCPECGKATTAIGRCSNCKLMQDVPMGARVCLADGCERAATSPPDDVEWRCAEHLEVTRG